MSGNNKSSQIQKISQLYYRLNSLLVDPANRGSEAEAEAAECFRQIDKEFRLYSSERLTSAPALSKLDIN